MKFFFDVCILDMKKETAEADMKRQESLAQILQFMIECHSELMESVMFGKDRIDYTRRGSVAAKFS